MFLYPALSPVFYGSSIILGGLLGAHRFGIAALAYGALVGSFVGPFLINSIGAANAGLRYRWNFDFRNPEFREWVKLSIPLMLGVSLVSADDWILRYFASGGAGEISRLNYAKRLFALPISILGQAAGQASMPFFARLFGEGKRKEFADSVNQSVYRVGSAALARDCANGDSRAASRGFGLSSRALQLAGFAIDGDVLRVVLAFAGVVVSSGALCPRLLRCR